MRKEYLVMACLFILLAVAIIMAFSSSAYAANTTNTHSASSTLNQVTYGLPECSCGHPGYCQNPKETCILKNGCYQCGPSTTSTTSTSTTSTSTTSIYPGCPTATPNGGDCNVYKKFGTVVTDYPAGSAGNGNFVVTSSPETSNTPVISSVINFNNAKVQNLITCPVAPNPANTLEYFSTDIADGIYGNRCLAPSSPLTTNELLDIHTMWNTTAVANSSAGPAFNNLVRSDAYALTYDGAASYSGQTPNISNGYDTVSNIFQNFPSSKQRSIWTWYAEVANIPAMSNSISESADYPNLHYDVGYTVGCNSGSTAPCGRLADQYTYSFSTSATLSKLSSTTMPVPSVNPSFAGENWISYNGGGYAPASSYATATCGALHSLSWCLGNGGYTVLGSGTLYYSNGATQSGYMATYQGDSNNYYLAWTSCFPDDLGFGCSKYAQMDITIWVVPQKTPYPTVNVGMYPYFLYNTSMPAVVSSATNRTEFLNLSFDMYSPTNYLSAANLDPFPIYTGDGFFATVTSSSNPFGTLTEFPSNLVSVGNPDPSAFSNGDSTFVMAETPSQVKRHNAGGQGILNGFTTLVGSAIGSLGNFASGPIYSPTYMAESPNNKIYIINYSTSCGTACFSTTMSSYLYVLSYIPKGYLNLTNNPPSAVTANTLNEWKSNWKKYWQISSTEQSSNLYITNVYNLTSDTNSWWGLGGYSNSCTGSHCIYSLVPYAMTTDYADDVFVFGATASTVSSSSPTYEMAGVLSNGTIVANNNLQDVPSTGVYSMAADAGGSYVYLPNTTGDILAYSVKSDFSPAGAIPLSYSPTWLTANMATMDYMAHGGPFGNAIISNFYSNALAENSNGGAFNGLAVIGMGNDTASNHDPIAIAGYQGLIYVLDWWTYHDCVLNPYYYQYVTNNIIQTTNSRYPPCSQAYSRSADRNPYYDNLNSSILMLRVLTPNGTEVKINPVNYSDLVVSNSMDLGFINANAGSYFNDAQPPYGWPLSANLSYINTSGFPAYITYCASECNFTPANLDTAYEPIGPLIPADGDINSGGLYTSIGFSMDYGGTAYLLSNVSTSYTNNIYEELVGFRAPVFNYSKISLAANAQYFCYLSTAPDSGSTTCMTPSDSSGSTYTSSDAAVLLNMTPPFIEMPSSFSYAESQGSPSIYQSALSAFSTFGIGGSNSGSSTSTSTTTIDYANTINEQLTNGAAPATGYTYINTSIGGAFLIPLHYSYSLSKKWSSPSSCTQIYRSNGISTGSPCVSTYSKGKIILPVRYCDNGTPCSYNVPFGSTQSSNRDIYAVAQYPVHTTSLNYTIQGGATLLQYLTTGNFYAANLSDKNTILPPLISYNLLTDRLIGSVYINQTVNPVNNVVSPLVVNYTRILDYGTQTYDIKSSLGTFPSYKVELSNSINPVTGANQLPAAEMYVCKYIPTSPYYSCSWEQFAPASIYPGNSLIDLALAGPNVNAPFSLFSIYKLASYSDSFSYSLLGSKQALGYDRLVYMMTDEFGNLLKAPIDADISNLTSIQLSHSISTNPNNPNESTIEVSGTAMNCQGTLLTGCQPMPSGSPIYVYYDTNLNYYNSTSSQSSNPASFFAWAENCAFSPLSTGCTLANPTYTWTWTSTGGAYSHSDNVTGIAEANYPTFHTQYNNSAAKTCAKEPSSLLASSLHYNCNIYGKFGLPKTASYPTGTAYCVPLFLNGTGHLTTQLGLVSVAYTESNGNFSEKFNVCGTGTAKITASYYGAPTPEPMLYAQPDIANATYTATQFASVGHANANTLEFNYSYSPYSAVQTFPVGIYALPYGKDSAIIAVLTVLALIAISIAFQRRSAARG